VVVIFVLTIGFFTSLTLSVLILHLGIGEVIVWSQIFSDLKWNEGTRYIKIELQGTKIKQGTSKTSYLRINQRHGMKSFDF